MEQYTINKDALRFGDEYEKKIGTLMALRCCEFKVDDAILLFNVKKLQEWEDLIIFRDAVSDNCVNIFVTQLKYKDKNSAGGNEITSSEFFNKDGKFYLDKYYNRYKSIMNEDIEDINKLCKITQVEKDNIILNFHTNMSISAELLPYFKKCDDEQFLNEGGEVYIFRGDYHVLKKCNSPFTEKLLHFVQQDEMKMEFMKKLHLFIKQADTDTLTISIANTIEKYVEDNHGISASKHSQLFENFITTWMEGYAEGHKRIQHYLTKQRIIAELNDILLGDYFKKFYQLTKHIPENQRNYHKFQEIVAKCKIIFVSPFNKEICHYLRGFINRALTDNNFINKENLNPFEDLKKMINNNRDEEKVYKRFWKLGCVPLILEVDNEADFLFVVKVLNNFSFNCKFILLVKDIDLSKNFSYGTITVMTNLSDLSDENLKNSILDNEVNFQGRGSFKIREIVNNIPNVDTVISGYDIINILQGTCCIGTASTTLPQFCIPQRISRVILRVEVFTMTLQTIFVIIGNNVQKFLKFLEKTSFYANCTFYDNFNIRKDDLESKKCLIVCPQADKNPPQNLSDFNIHFIIFDSNHKQIEWIKSTGDVSDLRLYIQHTPNNIFYDPDDLVNIFNIFPDFVTVITAESQMGKSFMLNKIAPKMPVDKWIVHINRESFISKIHKISPNSCISMTGSLLKNFNKPSKSENSTSLNSVIFSYFLSKNRIVVLLDDYDKIASITPIEINKSEKYSVWITALPSKVHENQFRSSLFYSLCPHNETDQINCLKDHLIGNNRLRGATKQLIKSALKEMKDYLGDHIFQQLGIPFQTEMLWLFFKCHPEYIKTGNISKYDQGSLIFHKMFTESKENLFPAECSIRESYIWIALYTLFADNKRIYPHIEKNIKQLTKKDLISTNSMVKLENERWSFNYPTIAEYYVAVWLDEHCDENSQYKVISYKIIEELTELKYFTLKILFDKHVTQDLTLHREVLNCNVTAIKRILNNNKNAINETDKINRTPLSLLCSYGKQFPMENIDKDICTNIEPILKESKLAKLLVKDNTISEDDILQLRWIKYSISNHCLGVLNGLAAKIKKIEIPPNHLNAYLYHCARYGFLDLTKNILTNITIKNEINNREIYANFPLLHIASKYGNTDIISILLDNGVEINQPNRYKKIALHLAAFNGRLEAVKLLLKNEADVTFTDEEGFNALHHAIKGCNEEVVNLLIERGKTAFLQKTNSGNTMLHLAATSGNVAILQRILSKVTTVDATNKRGETALHYIIKQENKLSSDFKKKVILLLHKNNADFNAITKQNEGVLHFAARYCDQDIVDLLINYNADLNKLDANGKNILHYAIEGCSKAIIEYILKLDEKIIDSVTNKEKTVVHYIAKCNNREIISLLCSFIKDFNAIDVKGNTGLHVAAKQNNLEAVEILLNYGVKASIPNKKNYTAIDYAKKKKLALIIKLLQPDNEE